MYRQGITLSRITLVGITLGAAGGQPLKKRWGGSDFLSIPCNHQKNSKAILCPLMPFGSGVMNPYLLKSSAGVRNFYLESVPEVSAIVLY